MKPVMQTRVWRGQEPHERGNCLPACIASILELDSAEAVLQVQEYFNSHDFKHQEHEFSNWYDLLDAWLEGRGISLSSHGAQYAPETNWYYIAGGKSPRGISHAVVYQNGQLVHDPHPDGGGILEATHFYTLEPMTEVDRKLHALRYGQAFKL